MREDKNGPQSDDIFAINPDVVNGLTREEFFKQGFDWEGTFETVDEFKEFFLSVQKAYPEGTPWKHLTERINSYRFTKITQSLIQKGLIVETYDENGNAAFTATQEAKDLFKNG